jgi:hypothetical protein
MDFLKIFLIINLSIVLASCSNSVVVKIDKDKRIITRELKNGKIKNINQKFNSLFNQWFDVECASKETSFAKCDDEEIIYTKLATIKIKEIKEMYKNQGSSSNEDQSSSNEDQSSSNEDQSSSNEDQSSSNEENNNFADNDSPDANDDTPDSHSPVDGHPPAD